MSSGSIPKEEPRSGTAQHKQIQNYVIGKTLGEGTFGKVKIGIHLPTQQSVAVKILQKAKIQDAGDLKRVTRELLILKKLRHPHLIHLYEIIETNNNLYLIMEFAENGELFQYIVKNKRLNEAECARLYFQFVAGIKEMHKLGIVHRDLKPENLLLDSQMNVKIADFGLGNLYKDNELLGTACGSPCYAAPEMIAGKKYTAVLVDIWSSGITLFAMATGYLPFDHQDTNLLYKKILGGSFTVPPYISQELKDFLVDLLEKDPEKRITIGQMYAHPFYIKHHAAWSSVRGVHGEAREVDQQVVMRVEKLGFDQDEVFKSLVRNDKNPMTATYYLLKKQQQEDQTLRHRSLCNTERLVQQGQGRNASVQQGRQHIEMVPKSSQEQREKFQEKLINSLQVNQKQQQQQYQQKQAHQKESQQNEFDKINAQQQQYQKHVQQQMLHQMKHYQTTIKKKTEGTPTHLEALAPLPPKTKLVEPGDKFHRPDRYAQLKTPVDPLRTTNTPFRKIGEGPNTRQITMNEVIPMQKNAFIIKPNSQGFKKSFQYVKTHNEKIVRQKQHSETVQEEKKTVQKKRNQSVVEEQDSPYISANEANSSNTNKLVKLLKNRIKLRATTEDKKAMVNNNITNNNFIQLNIYNHKNNANQVKLSQLAKQAGQPPENPLRKNRKYKAYIQ